MQLCAHTGVGDGGYLFDRLKEEISRSTRHDLPLALMLFRVSADGTSPSAVDALTRAAVLLARHFVRDSDVVAWLGSGHFGVLANTPPRGAETLAASLAQELRAFEFTCADRALALQVSYGVSCLGERRTPGELLDEARAALDLARPLASSECPSLEAQAEP